jgi:hypothetical protein
MRLASLIIVLPIGSFIFSRIDRQKENGQLMVLTYSARQANGRRQKTVFPPRESWPGIDGVGHGERLLLPLLR